MMLKLTLKNKMHETFSTQEMSLFGFFNVMIFMIYMICCPLHIEIFNFHMDFWTNHMSSDIYKMSS
jgi:hypothetical protein